MPPPRSAPRKAFEGVGRPECYNPYYNYYQEIMNLHELRKKNRARMTLWEKVRCWFDIRFRYETWVEVRMAKNKKQLRFERFYGPSIIKRNYTKPTDDKKWHLNPWKHL